MIQLSILVPSVPSRLGKLADRFQMLQELTEGKPVEVLAFTDNKRRSVGLKRDALVQIARGEYLAFADDDDEIYPCYVEEMLAGCATGADVISTRQHATVNGGNKYTVDFSIHHPNEEARQVNGVWADIKRKPFHVCGWKTTIAQRHRFPDASYGEDWHWCKRALKDVKNEHKRTEHIMCYHWSASGTEAELTFPKGYIHA